MTIIGITGGIASGKTQVAKYFGELGARVIDADKLANKALSRKAVKKKIASALGSTALRKGIPDRKRLGQIVFSDSISLKKLCGIIHPVVIKEIKRIVKRSRDKVVIVDAPLLIESGLHRQMDKVIVVKAKRATQLARCLDRGLSRLDALRRIRAQMPLPEKLRHADFIISSECAIVDTRKQVLDIWRKLA